MDPHNTHRSYKSSSEDEVDLKKIFILFVDYKWILLKVAIICALLGLAYHHFQQPIYEAKSLVQVEEKSSAVTGVSNFAEQFNKPESTSVEIEVLKSRKSLQETIDALDLQTVAKVKHYTIFGKFWARFLNQKAEITLSHLKFEKGTNALFVKIINREKGLFHILDHKKNFIREGVVGQDQKHPKFVFTVREFSAQNGTLFHIYKRSMAQTVSWLRANLSIKQKGVDRGRFSWLRKREIQEFWNLVLQRIVLK